MSGSTTDLHTLHNTLSRYVNSGCLTSRDKYLALLSTNIPFRLNTGNILELYQRASDSCNDSRHEKQVFSIPVYSGTNRFVHTMMEYLEKHLRDYLYGAYVHGSLGTYEEMAYSDFDAIVILAEKAFRSKRDLVKAATLLYNARRIMTDYDALQHHGWFTLTSISLNAYPDSYFPAELFSYSKALFHDKGTELSIRVLKNKDEYRNGLAALANHVLGQLSAQLRPKNVYQLKNLLSEFMLLPACYVQARDGAGIFKKYSFDSAGIDFDDSVWSIMADVSDIRSNWSYSIGHVRNRLITHNSVAGRMAAQHFSPKIPREIENIFTESFYQRMHALAKAMLEKTA